VDVRFQPGGQTFQGLYFKDDSAGGASGGSGGGGSGPAGRCEGEPSGGGGGGGGEEGWFQRLLNNIDWVYLHVSNLPAEARFDMSMDQGHIHYHADRVISRVHLLTTVGLGDAVALDVSDVPRDVDVTWDFEGDGGIWAEASNVVVAEGSLYLNYEAQQRIFLGVSGQKFVATWDWGAEGSLRMDTDGIPITGYIGYLHGPFGQSYGALAQGSFRVNDACVSWDIDILGPPWGAPIWVCFGTLTFDGDLMLCGLFPKFRIPLTDADLVGVCWPPTFLVLS
jgi:hypothetical protein